MTRRIETPDDDDDEGLLMRRDKNGWHVNLDLVLLYLAATIALVVIAIKAIRWAVES